MKQDLDLIVIGGGIMGLMTAYYASLQGKKVTILEKSYIGNQKAASFSLTRSIRNDYLDPFYARLAREARNLWEEIEEKSTEKFIINCGCLNLVKKQITPDISKTYALQSYKNLQSLGFASKRFSKTGLKNKFPQFDADLGTIDQKAGFLYLPTITENLLRLLKIQKVQIKEYAQITSITQSTNKVSIKCKKAEYSAKKVVITSGIWTNETLKLVKNCKIQFPIRPDRPSQCKYFIPPKDKLDQFRPENLPVFAYLDVGIYGHPIYNEKTKGVKIGYYNPPDIQKKISKINSIEDFVKYCMPALKGATAIDVTEVDQCFYQMVDDDNFILGKLPGFNNIYVGCGWRGTGYKFAPLIGKILAQLVFQQGTVYNIDQFSPARFTAKKEAVTI